VFSHRRTSELVLGLAAAASSGALLWLFHARSWYPIDEGNYAHVAERLAAGEVLNGQVQDIHAGYINFLNAGAFRLFGIDLLSLRYPLVAAALLEAVLVYALVARRNPFNGFAAAIAVTTLGIIQFLNPTAHWYCGLIAVAVTFWLVRVPARNRFRLIGAGLFVGLAMLFRQLSGIWIGMAVVLVALAERDEGAAGREAVLSRAAALLMFVVLLIYVISTDEWFGAVLIAATPAALLAWAVVSLRTSNRTTLRIARDLGIGTLLSALPLVAYHVTHGSLHLWFADTVVAASSLPRLGFFGRPWYAAAVVAGLQQTVSSLDPVRWVNGLYWAALPLAALVNGVLVLRRIQRGVPIAQMMLPVMAVFYALVSLHFQIPIYLYYSVGLSLAALLWQTAEGRAFERVGSVACVLTLACVGIWFHAAQPYSRTPLELLQGARRTTSPVRGFARASLLIEPGDVEVYGRLVSIIQHDVDPGGTMLAVPSDAELYFLADRRNPFRFYNTALGIRTNRDLSAVLDVLLHQPPSIVTFRPDDKYNTDASMRIMNVVRNRYERIETIGGVEVYRLRGSGRSTGTPSGT
jgi:hypothetical protein